MYMKQYEMKRNRERELFEREAAAMKLEEVKNKTRHLSSINVIGKRQNTRSKTQQVKIDFEKMNRYEEIHQTDEDTDEGKQKPGQSIFTLQIKDINKYKKRGAMSTRRLSRQVTAAAETTGRKKQTGTGPTVSHLNLPK